MILKASDYRMNKSRLIGDNWGFVNENYDKDDIKVTNKTDHRVVQILGTLKKEQVRWQEFLSYVIGTEYEQQMWRRQMILNKIKYGILDVRDSSDKDEVRKWLAHQIRKEDDDITVYEESYVYG